MCLVENLGQGSWLRPTLLSQLRGTTVVLIGPLFGVHLCPLIRKEAQEEKSGPIFLQHGRVDCLRSASERLILHGCRPRVCGKEKRSLSATLPKLAEKAPRTLPLPYDVISSTVCFCPVPPLSSAPPIPSPQALTTSLLERDGVAFTEFSVGHRVDPRIVLLSSHTSLRVPPSLHSTSPQLWFSTG